MRTKSVTTLEHQASELLSDLQQRLVVLEGIAQGEMMAAEGRILTHAQAKERMARWLKSGGK